MLYFLYNYSLVFSVYTIILLTILWSFIWDYHLHLLGHTLQNPSFIAAHKLLFSFVLEQFLWQVNLQFIQLVTMFLVSYSLICSYLYFTLYSNPCIAALLFEMFSVIWRIDSCIAKLLFIN